MEASEADYFNVLLMLSSLYISRITDKYSLLPKALNSVISVVHFCNGLGAVNCRCKRLGSNVPAESPYLQ